jgi:hypothetical protein
MPEVEKPPVGLRPRFVVVEERIHEIQEAVKRYVSANKAVPAEWLSELDEHTQFLSRDLSLERSKPVVIPHVRKLPVGTRQMPISNTPLPGQQNINVH